MGQIIAGVLAPHPPHLIYGENPPQNEPRSECGWETLRWGYEACRKKILALKPEVFVVHASHWPTHVGTHLLGLERFQGLSVDPAFPHLFRYAYDVQVDLELSLAIAESGQAMDLETTLVRHREFRLDHGSIVSLHMMNPSWDIPVVIVSANQAYVYGSREVQALSQATRHAIHRLNRRAVILSSSSLSHRYVLSEPEIIEDMSFEHIYDHGQYLWDMKILTLCRQGKTQQILDILPEFNEMAAAEIRASSLAWMFGCLAIPDYPAQVHGYGSVMGTGNAIVSWVDPAGGGV